MTWVGMREVEVIVAHGGCAPAAVGVVDKGSDSVSFGRGRLAEAVVLFVVTNDGNGLF